MRRMLNLLQKHQEWRKNCLNLIASENVMSPLAEKVYLSDLKYRYAEGLPSKRYYQGLKFIDKIEELTSDLFKDHFQVNFVDLRPISGTLANLAVFSALAERGDLILTLGMRGGAHISHEKVGVAGILGFKIEHLEWDSKTLSFNVEQAKEKIEKLSPKFVVIGGSVILFPQPIKELKEICRKRETKIIYDGAHVFGLISAGFFQDPLKEGADVLTASTHKTFPGPQGGIILGNLSQEFQKRIQKKVFPGTVSNHHLHRIPALFVTLKEIKKFGKDYSRQIILNAKALGQTLAESGFKVLGAEKGFTETHQIMLDVEDFGGGERVACLLEEANIIVNKNVLPGGEINVVNPSGIRLGVQEMTRFGMKEDQMKEIARLMKKVVIDKKNPKIIQKKVIHLRASFQEIKYCFSA